MAPSETIVVTWRGCGCYKKMKKNGLCEDHNCIPSESKKGKRIEKQANIIMFPQAVKWKNGKYVKVSTGSYMRKYDKKTAKRAKK